MPEPVIAAAPLVLLVEDNPVNQIMGKAMLKKQGCDIVTADDGAQAVAAVQQQRFDLILMDCQMPVMDGFAATAAIRALVQSGSIAPCPIIAVTGNDQEGDAAQCLAAGMDDYIKKPMALDDVTRILTRWVTSAS